MNRRNFLKAAGLAGASLALCGCGASMRGRSTKGKRPNVLIFYTDDQGTLDVNCYGSKDLYTPNMDSLAATGVRFTQAYAHTVCCPSRALLHTGRHPQRSGVNTWVQGNAKGEKKGNMYLEEITLAEALKAQGYRTALFGKWHLGAHLDYGPTKQGFDEFLGLRDGFIDNYNHYYLHGKGFHDLYRGTEEVFEPGKYFPDLVVREAIRFLDENKSGPFFLCVAFNIPHYPEQADSKFDSVYGQLPEPRRSYAKIVSTTDDRMGKILKKLDELGLRDETIIIFTSDNGHSSESYKIKVDDHASGLPKGHNYGANGGGGNTGNWRGAKHSFFEGGIRVPAVISYPARLPQNVVRDQAVTLADFYPTVLELCDVPLPGCKLDGKSLMRIIKSEHAPTHHKVMHWQWQNMWAVRQGDWKLIYNGRDTTDEWQGKPEPRREMPRVFLGNLADDQPELRNHADEHPDLVRRLMKLHEQWAKEVQP
ncbi:MAG TPA: sulfatase-like hydrolase/transferase [Sedimentisphaerales bacterium]|nr:sulfatase-like hydrolase/transferase [Sedimentisphaerales bacterium]